MMGPLLLLLRCSSCWTGVNPVRLLEIFCEHDAELGQYLLTLISRHLLGCTYRIMKYGPLIFPVVPHKDGALAHHLEVGPLLENF